MMEGEGLLAIGAIISLATLVMGVFFIIRGVYRFKEWRDGNNDELWPFLAFIIGGGCSIVMGFGSILFFSEVAYQIFYGFSPIFMIVGLAVIGLMTYYYILKWREME